MEEPQSSVIISCPNTGHEVFTGMLMTAAELDEWREAKFELTVACPFCSERHKWTGVDARLCK